MLWFKNIFLILILTLYCYADLELFKISEVELKKTEYPWVDELYLEVKGLANKSLKNGFLTISLYYEKNKVTNFNYLLKSNNDNHIPFEHKWGPLNSATQEIQMGKYQITVEFILKNQQTIIHDKLTQLIQQQKISSVKKDIFIGNTDQRKEQQNENKLFYLNTMKETNKIFSELIAKRNGVFRNIAGQKEGSLSIEKWEIWVGDQFLTKILQQKETLEKKEKQLFALRYPTTHNNMKLYCKLLKELAINYAQSFRVYQRNKSVPYKPPYQDRAFTKQLRTIRRLHDESAKEMRLDLEKELGFNPPPMDSF